MLNRSRVVMLILTLSSLSFGGCGSDTNLAQSGVSQSSGSASVAVLRSIRLTPSNYALARGGSIQLRAIGTYSDGTSSDLTYQIAWSSSDPSVTVSSSGLATAVGGSGSATISAVLNGVVGSASVTIPESLAASAWGYNFDGQLGNGSTVNSTVPVEVSQGAVPPGVLFTAVSAGDGHSLGLGNDGQLYGWGENGAGELGTGSNISSYVPVAVDQSSLPNQVTFTSIVAGHYRSLALGSDGRVYGWGFNNFGQLGNGSTVNSNLPVVVSQGAVPTGVSFVAASGAGAHTLGLGSDGKIYAWGHNPYGELGDGTTTDSAVPVAVLPGALPPGVSYTAVCASEFDSVALASDGKIYAWGNNDFGQLGDGSTTESLVPVAVGQGEVPPAVTFTSISMRQSHCLARATNGKLYAWGFNAGGFLGNGSSQDFSSLPVEVSQGALPPGATFVAGSAGGSFSLALGSDGKLYAWGDNSFGQFGDGNTTSSSIPVVAGNDGRGLDGTAVTLFSAGLFHSLVLSGP